MKDKGQLKHQRFNSLGYNEETALVPVRMDEDRISTISRASRGSRTSRHGGPKAI